MILRFSVAASRVHLNMGGTTRTAIEPIIDDAIYEKSTDNTIKTVTMLPDRRLVCPFRNLQAREKPSAISENLADW
jgi:hypothetical protein